jgi:hypothetical protein
MEYEDRSLFACGVGAHAGLCNIWFYTNILLRFPVMSKLYKPNGEKECERRRKQIARGQLKEENGLVVKNAKEASPGSE